MQKTCVSCLLTYELAPTQSRCATCWATYIASITEPEELTQEIMGYEGADYGPKEI